MTIKKFEYRRIYSLLLIFAILLPYGCHKNEDSYIQDNELRKNFALSSFGENLINKMPKLKEIWAKQYDINSSISTSFTDKKDESSFAEEEVNTLIEISKAFLKEYENLNDQELNKAFEGLNEEDFIFTSLIIWGSHREKNMVKTIRLKSGAIEGDGDWDGERVLHCIAAALGLNIIDDLISNTAALMTVQGTTQLLKTLGKRYLGWIGVGIAVYEFGNCMDVW